MDPALARGMTKRFFDEFPHEVSKSIDRFHDYSIKNSLPNRPSKWSQFFSGLEENVGPLLIGKATCGSLKKPCIAISTLESEDARPVNSWSERCVGSAQMLLNFRPWAVRSEYVGFNVSEHTIRRIFERSISSSIAREKGISWLSPVAELKYLPTWSSYWIMRAVGFFGALPAGELHVAVPAPSGILLGTVRTVRASCVEIRTFVDVGRLSKTQLDSRSKMIALTRCSRSSLVAMAPILHMAAMTPRVDDALSEFGARVEETFPDLEWNRESGLNAISVERDLDSE